MFLKGIFEYIEKISKNSYELWLLGLVASIVSISSVVSFFIPLKIILLLENPDALNRFEIDTLYKEYLLYMVAFVFIISVIFSLFGKLYINKKSTTLRAKLWQDYQKRGEKTFKKAQFDRVFKNFVALYSGVVSMGLVFFIVLFLEYFIAIFLFVFLLISIKLANSLANKKDIKYEIHTIFQIICDSGFYLTFILILFMWFVDLELELLQILLAFMLSRIFFRSLNQFSIQIINIHKELKK